MRQVRGTESIFYIKHEGIWCPVACETSSGMSEQTEMISTTTRDNGGWKTEKPTLQGYSISVSGALVNELPSFDYYGRNLILNSDSPTVAPMTNNYISHNVITTNGYNGHNAYSIVSNDGNGGDAKMPFTQEGRLSYLFGKKFVVSFYARASKYVNANYKVANYGVKEWNIGANGSGDSFGKKLSTEWQRFVFLVNENCWFGFTIQAEQEQKVLISLPKVELGNKATPYSIAPEEQKILSYFKLRQKKRNRELIEWKRETLGGRYLDSGKAYITDISDENPVDDMMAFTMTLSGFGKPDFVADDSVIVAEAFANYNDDLVANSNNQILEP